MPALMDLVWVGSHSRGTRIKLNEFVVWIAPLKAFPLFSTGFDLLP